jgi:wobble nucleotide-excising tRNase
MIQFNIENIEKELKEENATISQLKQLIAEIEDNRILRFTSDEIGCKFQELLDKGIVFKDGSIVNGKDIGIKTDPLFLYAFYEHFSKTLNFNYLIILTNCSIL